MADLEFLDDAIREWEEIRGQGDERLRILRGLRDQLAANEAAPAPVRELLTESSDFQGELAQLLVKAGLRLSRPESEE